MDDDEEDAVLHAMGTGIIEVIGKANLSVESGLALLCSLAGTLIKASAKSVNDREAMIEIAQRIIGRSARRENTIQ